MEQESHEFLAHKKHPSERIFIERHQPRFHSNTGYFHFLSSRYRNSDHYKNLGGLEETIGLKNSKNQPATERERVSYEQAFDRGLLLGIHAMNFEFEGSEELSYGALALDRACVDLKASTHDYETTMTKDELTRFLLLERGFKQYDAAPEYHKLVESLQINPFAYDGAGFYAESDFYPQLLFQAGFGFVHGAMAETPQLYKNELALWHELEAE